MNIDLSTKNAILARLRGARDEITPIATGGDLWAQEFKDQLSEMIEEVTAFEPVEIVPFPDSIPAVIFRYLINGVESSFAALPATPAVLAYLNNPVRRKSRTELTAELSAQNEIQVSRLSEPTNPLSAATIVAYLDTRERRFGRDNRAILLAKAKILSTFSLNVEKIDNRSINFKDSHDGTTTYHVEGEIIDLDINITPSRGSAVTSETASS